MSGYLAVVAARFRSLLQYRAAAIGGLFTQLFFGVVRIMILEAFYAASSSPAPMALPDVIGYIWLGQATLLLVPWRNDEDVAEQIRSGTIVYELTRPLDLYGVWLARSIAWRTAPVFLRMLPMFVFAMLLLPAIAPDWALSPPSLASFAMWIPCFAGAVLVSAALSALMTVSLMWTIAGDGVSMIVGTLATALSGLVIPLPLFPDWAKPVIYALPFCGLMDLPSRVFTGDIAPSGASWVLAHQLAWFAVLVGAGRWFVSRGVRRLVVQGG